MYRRDAAACAGCVFAAQCLPTGRRTRTVERGPDDPVREAMAAKVRTPAGAALYRQRKEIVEPVFGILKEVLAFRQFSRRGLAAATSEFTRLALAYNIKVLARGTPRTTPPPLAPPAAGVVAPRGAFRRFAALFGRGQRLLSALPDVQTGRRGQTPSRRLLPAVA